MRYHLAAEKLPTAWFNVLPRLPEPLQPPLHPGTREPVGPDDLAPLFPMALIEQEMSAAPWIDIPGEVLDVLRLWRPTPLVRAHRLEQALGTPARIYYKDESGSPAGSHKPNTAVPQAFYNQQDGIKRLTTETGAGQWGTALAFACAQYDLECKVYMVRTVVRHQALPAGDHGDVGRGVRAVAGRRPVVAGLARAWPSPTPCATPPPATTRHYALGSVLNHVLLHQTVIGLEAKEQLAMAGETPARRRDRAVRRRLEPRRPVAAVHGGRRRAAGGRRAVVVPDAHRGPLRVRLRRHRGHDPAAADVHARPRLHAADASTPAGCATTATRRSSACW